MKLQRLVLPLLEVQGSQVGVRVEHVVEGLLLDHGGLLLGSLYHLFEPDRLYCPFGRLGLSPFFMFFEDHLHDLKFVELLLLLESIPNEVRVTPILLFSPNLLLLKWIKIRHIS